MKNILSLIIVLVVCGIPYYFSSNDEQEMIEYNAQWESAVYNQNKGDMVFQFNITDDIIEGNISVEGMTYLSHGEISGKVANNQITFETITNKGVRIEYKGAKTDEGKIKGTYVAIFGKDIYDRGNWNTGDLSIAQNNNLTASR